MTRGEIYWVQVELLRWIINSCGDDSKKYEVFVKGRLETILDILARYSDDHLNKYVE